MMLAWGCASRSGGRWRGSALVLLAAVLVVAGCGAVLTKPQAAAIQDFAKADDTFVKLPSAVVRSYEEVHLETRTFDATTVAAKDASRGVTQLVRAIQFSLQDISENVDSIREDATELKEVVAGMASSATKLGRELGLVDDAAKAVGALAEVVSLASSHGLVP